MSFDDIFSVLSDFRKSMLAEVDSLDQHDLLQLAVDVHAVKGFVGELFNEVQALVSERVGFLGEPVQVDGASVEIKAGEARKTWDHGGLAAEVSRRLVDSNVDLETGEVLLSPRELVERAFRFAGVSYWRVGELKKLNIDADDFCEVGERKVNVVVRRDR